MAGLRTIKAGPGREALPPAGHLRREMLKARTDNLDAMAEKMLNETDAPLYAVDPAKLKEEPEILRHLNFASMMFEVTDPVPGKVYLWERDTNDDHSPIARKRAEARMWLGAGARGWEVVSGTGPDMPESRELLQADNTRRIGDVLLMRIDRDEYIRIQKRIMLVTRFHEANVAEKLSDFVRRNEGLVKVIQGNAEPRELYQREHPGHPLVHSDRLGATS